MLRMYILSGLIALLLGATGAAIRSVPGLAQEFRVHALRNFAEACDTHAKPSGPYPVTVVQAVSHYLPG
jgi:hypothetical protein